MTPPQKMAGLSQQPLCVSKSALEAPISRLYSLLALLRALADALLRKEQSFPFFNHLEATRAYCKNLIKA